MVFLVAVEAERGEDFRRDDWRDGGVVEAGIAFDAAWERFRGVVFETGVAVAEEGGRPRGRAMLADS